MTPATSERALECYQAGNRVDPGYALAWAGIADTYPSRPFNSDTRPSDVSDDARAAAALALDIGETVAEAHTSMGRVRFLFDWDWPGAEANLAASSLSRPGFRAGALDARTCALATAPISEALA